VTMLVDNRNSGQHTFSAFPSHSHHLAVHTQNLGQAIE
jgi:hypothetical protein